jgi:hypothetical protein
MWAVLSPNVNPHAAWLVSIGEQAISASLVLLKHFEQPR